MSSPVRCVLPLSQPRQRSLALVLALIISLTMFGGPRAAVAAESSDVQGSDISTSQPTLTAGEQLTVTITLRNSGSSTESVDVISRVPDPLSYVPGSVTAGGTYNPGGHVLSWDQVQVPAGGTRALSYRVTPDGAVSAATSVVLTAAISASSARFVTTTAITLVPGAATPAPSNLRTSDKTISQPSFAPQEQVTYTITLRNTGDAPVNVDVRDPLPEKLDYVAGSATVGGVYNEATHTVSWTGVNVPANGSIALSFQVAAAVFVNAPSFITNTALITYGGTTFNRSVTALLTNIPITLPWFGLGGSYKTASQTRIGPNEQCVYTIRLINSSTTDAVATVRDALPNSLSYVAGSVSGGGSFDSSTRTLTWQNIVVPAGEDRSLSFAVKPATTVSTPTSVLNIASITVNNQTFSRRSAIVLTPAGTPNDGSRPPHVDSVRISDRDILSSRQVRLHIDAEDDQRVWRMFVREWQLSTQPTPRWSEVRSSGWIPFQSDYSWTLGAENGAHYVAVWVADEAGNTSRLDRQSVDFASLVQPGMTVAQNVVVPYLAGYSAGANVQTTLTPRSGNADLYVWYPGSAAQPDRQSTQPGSAAETISFTTPRAGTYLFLVRGATAASYDLSITPAGGPRARWQPATTSQAGRRIASTTTATVAAADPTSESILTQSGLDPLANATLPVGPFAYFLPSMGK